MTAGGRYALDVPVAALAGLSVAFLTFAAPADLLADLTASTGLSAILPDGEPAGIETRIGVGAAGAVAVFAAAFLLLRWLDRFGARPAANRVAIANEVTQVPRLRRRDFHPDAPPRPPLMAAHELGEPEPAPRPVDEPRAEARRTAAAVESISDPLPAAPPRGQPVAAAPASDAGSIMSAKAAPARPATAPAEAVPPPQDAGLTELMARLEQGLARRRATPPVPSTAATPTPFAGTADDRLQSAIASLQRLAAQGD